MQIARGVSGELRAGYQVAAYLGAWSVTLADRLLSNAAHWTCVAQVRATDDYWLEHGTAFALHLDMGARVWSWSRVSVSWENGDLVLHGEGSPDMH